MAFTQFVNHENESDKISVNAAEVLDTTVELHFTAGTIKINTIVCCTYISLILLV